jgi:hypothetical protein
VNNDKFKVINETKKIIIYTNDILVNYPKKCYVLKDKIESEQAFKTCSQKGY